MLNKGKIAESPMQMQGLITWTLRKVQYFALQTEKKNEALGCMM
jgi:hypothetical protein